MPPRFREAPEFAFNTVCVSQERAEVVFFDGVGRSRVDRLCGARDGRIVHRQSDESARG